MANEPRIKAIKINVGEIQKINKPRIKAIKIQNTKQFNNIIYNGTLYTGNLK